MKLKTILPAALMTLSFSVHAQIPLTEEVILGSWSVDKESIKRDGTGSKELKTVWTFNQDGTMVGESTDSQAHARMEKVRAVLKYRLEDGKIIKQVSPGRAKQETCEALELELPKMLLKCKNIFFFMTKK